MYHYGYGMRSAEFGGLWVILILAGAILLYCTFLHPKNDGKFTGFLGVLYDLLTFKKIVLETVLRIFYLIAALAVTLGGLKVVFGVSLIGGLLVIVLGNILVRVLFEASLIILIICRNTTEINRKLGGKTQDISFDPVTKDIHMDSIVSGIKSAGEKIRSSAEMREEGTADSVEQFSGEKRHCENCGYELENDDVYCPNCGTKNSDDNGFNGADKE